MVNLALPDNNMILKKAAEHQNQDDTINWIQEQSDNHNVYASSHILSLQ